MVRAPHVAPVGAVLALVALGAAPTAQPTSSSGQGARFSAGTLAVEVYATVTRGDGSPVPRLTANDFELLEDGVVQPISVFDAGVFPATVALGIDRSFSMAGERLRVARLASQAFLRALPPDHHTMVWAISERADLIASVDSPRELQAQAVAALLPWGTTALFDGTVAALDRLDGVAGRRALVLFTDGEDRYSTATTAQLLDRVRRSQALVYPIAVGRLRPAVLAEMAALSGGRSLHVRDVRGLESALASVADELSRQYLLGYVPLSANGRPGWRSITVRLKTGMPGARVRARDGYLAP